MRFLKEYVIVGVILVFVFFMEHITNKNLSDSVKWMKDEITSIENKLEENKEGEAQEEFLDLKSKWEGEQEKLAFFVEHEELEKVSNDIVIIESNFEQNEADEIDENITDLKFMLDHIEEKNQFNLKNIF